MSDVVSTLTLRDRIRRDTGFENDSFALDAGLTDDILRSARWLADELISIGQEYARSTTTIATVNGTAVYALPTDFYRLLAVHATASGGTIFRAEPFEMADLEGLLNQTTGLRSEFGKYRTSGASAATPTETIEWAPTPNFVRNFRLDYIPTPVFTIASGEYNIRCYGPGWEEFILADVAARLLEREESDPSAFYARREQVLTRIKRRAPTRDASPVRPTRTRDAYGFNKPRKPWPTERW